jgi:hypothetical protein
VEELRYTGDIDREQMVRSRSGVFIWPRYWWLNLLLLALTFLSTTAFGSVLAEAFRLGLPLDTPSVYRGYSRLLHLDPSIWSGLPFSVSLLTILMAHELGHYLTCRHWRVDASLPYFLPSPFLLGTFGAFIRIRSPIYTRTILFDIGASGPFAGFVTLLPFLAAGIFWSRLAPGIGLRGEFVLSTPLLLRLAEYLRFGGAPASNILLHPVAVAAWAGLLATAINLLPIGQLDGGHILYSLFGERGHRIVATACVGVLVILGYFYWAWWIWAVPMFFFGRRHPLVYDSTPLPPRRVSLSAGALLVFILSMSVIPVAR